MNLWEAVLSRLEDKLDPQSFNTWFRPTSLAWRDARTLHVAVPNEVFRDWLAENYSSVIQESLRELEADPIEISFTLRTGDPSGSPVKATASGSSAAARPHEKDDNGNGTRPRNNGTAAQGGGQGGGRPAARTERAGDYQPPSLNRKYTFDTFVVGASNQLAHAAARAVAESPSFSYNPLFIYGGVGLGKTHLMHAIGHHIVQHDRSLLLEYLSTERFMNELINSIRYDRTIEFRERYRNIDVLLMDDIQFLAGKERTQEEFFHTFNALYDSQKQIVLTSDSPPKEIPTLEERLQSRFEWGLLADIQPPDLETKVAILKKKAETEAPGVRLPDDVLLYIATGSRTNIRELEGALIRLIAFSSLTGEDVDISLARRVLKDTLKSAEKTVTIDKIQERVSEYFGLQGDEIVSRSNARRITRPRQVAMFLCKKLTEHSLPEIGRAFGGKHHSTVIHSIRRVEEDIEEDESFHQEVNSLLESFQ